MLHKETREQLLKAYNETHNAKEVAECFSVNVSTVYRLAERMKTTGSIETKTHLRGRKPLLTQKDMQNIDKLIRTRPGITLNEIIHTLDLHVSDETVRKAVGKLGYVYKKKSYELKQSCEDILQ